MRPLFEVNNRYSTKANAPEKLGYCDLFTLKTTYPPVVDACAKCRLLAAGSFAHVLPFVV